METQKALEKHIEECKHRIEVIKIFLVTENRTIGECSENIETLKNVISALEKRIIKKPNKSEETVRFNTIYECPECGRSLLETDFKYCPCCGQAFDWGSLQD